MNSGNGPPLPGVRPSRRHLLTGTAAVGAMVAMTGCAPLRRALNGGDGTGVDGSLGRLDPASVDRDETWLEVRWVRPGPAADVLGVDDSADLSLRGTPQRRLEATTITDPSILVFPKADWGFELTPWHQPEDISVERLRHISEGVRVRRGAPEVTLWRGAAPLLEELEAGFGAAYSREGDQLRSQDPGIIPPVTSVVAAVGEDLLFTVDETLDGLDSGESTAEEFSDLPGLLAAIDLDDAHVAAGAVARDHDRGGEAVEWMWATRFDSEQEHTTRGAVRVDGDAGAYAQRLRDGVPRTNGRMVVEEAEPDGDVVRVVVMNDPPVEEVDWEDVHEFWTGMPSSEGPGVPLG